MRKRYAEIEIDPERCNGCAMCVAVCPEDVLAVKSNNGRLHAVTVWSAKCSGCAMCASICGRNALVVELLDPVPALV